MPAKTDQSVQSKKSVNKWFSLTIILFAPVISVIDVFIVNVSLPTIQTFYHTSNGQVQLIIASYLIGYAVFMITGSRLGDFFGRKKMLAAGIVLFTIASALCGSAITINYLIVFRFIQGISAAIMVPQSVTLLQLLFAPGGDRDKAIGIYGISLGFASVLGQFLGGFLIHAHWISDSWRLIFLINIPFGIIAALLVSFLLNESKLAAKTKFDFIGVFWLTTLLIFLILPITQGRDQGWPTWSVGMLLMSPVLLFVFIRDQILKKKAGLTPLINVDLFKISSFNLGILTVFFFYGLHNAFLLCCAIILQKAFLIPPYTASLLFTSLGWSFMLSSYWSIRNANRYGASMLQFGCIILIASFVFQGITFYSGTASYGTIIAGLSIYGCGSGLVLPSVMNVSLKKVPAELAGTSSGVFSTI